VGARKSGTPWPKCITEGTLCLVVATSRFGRAVPQSRRAGRRSEFVCAAGGCTKVDNIDKVDNAVFTEGSCVARVDKG